MPQRRNALLIATNTYTDPAFASLQAPEHDVAQLAEVLSDPDIGAFSVRSLLNRPSYVIRNEIDELCTTAERNDLILLYVSGHGIKDSGKGDLHFATTDTRRTLLTSTSVEAQLVRRLIDDSPARQVIVWLDCCYSGAFPAGATPKSAMDVDVIAQLKFADARGCCVMTASTHIQYAYEPNRDAKPIGRPQVSVFTNAIIDGLRTGKADLDNDGEIGTAELYDYVHRHVREHSADQTPTRNDMASGDLLVARNKFGLRLPPALSPAIRGLLKSPDLEDRLLGVSHLGNKAGSGDKTARQALAALRSSRDPDLAKAARTALEPLPDRDIIIKKEQPVPPPSVRTSPKPVEPTIWHLGTPPIQLPDQSMRRLSDARKYVSWAEFGFAVAVLVYLLWLHDGPVAWAVVLGLAAGLSLVNLGFTLYRMANDTSKVLWRGFPTGRSRMMFSPDGERLVNETIQWDTSNWTRTWRTWQPGFHTVFSPDNTMVTVRSENGGTQLIDRQTSAVRGELPHGTVAFSPDSRLAAVVTKNDICVVDIRAGSIGTRLSSRGRDELAEFDPAGRLLAAGTQHELVVYLTTTWHRVDLPGDFKYDKIFAFNHNGSLLATRTKDDDVYLWRTDTWAKVRTLSPGWTVGALTFSPDGKHLAVGHGSTIRLVSTTTWSWTGSKRLVGHHGDVKHLRFSPDSRILASTGHDETIRLWKIND